MTGSHLRRAILATLLAAAPGFAQAPVVEVADDLPFATRRVIDIALDAEGADVWTGERAIAADAVHEGPLVQVGGSLVLEGRVTGDLTAIDAELYLRPGARIEGDLLVLGGGYYGSTMATVTGRRTWLSGEPVVAAEVAPGRWRIERAVADLGFPFEAKGVAGVAFDDYNGVDGLALSLVAGLKTLPRQPRTELEFGPVLRTARIEDVGWRVRGLREFPRAGGLLIGGSTWRETQTPERWHRSDFPNATASLFFADDDRTYYESTGGEVWAERSFRLPFTVRLRAKVESFDSLETERPFALFADDEEWPVNPPIEAGRGYAVGARVRWERRNVAEFPTAGTWVEARVDHWGLGGDFAFDWAQADARGWLPIGLGEGSFAGLRLVAGGGTGDADSLAPQFWYRLGGGSTIPGYDARTPFLIGDRMAFATGTIHLGIDTAERMFERIYLVALGSIGDAWFEGEDLEAAASVGGGLAGHGETTYVGVFGAYGLETEEWELYVRISPWF